MSTYVEVILPDLSYPGPQQPDFRPRLAVEYHKPATVIQKGYVFVRLKEKEINPQSQHLSIIWIFFRPREKKMGRTYDLGTAKMQESGLPGNIFSYVNHLFPAGPSLKTRYPKKIVESSHEMPR